MSDATISSSPEDREKALIWLGHGAELARRLKGEKARHRDVIWCLLSEAVEIVDRLPDQDKRWLTSGTRSGGWSMVGMSKSELKELERVKTLSAMSPFEGTTKVSPQSADVDRALGVLEWMRWLNQSRLAERLKRATVAMARGGETEAVRRLYSPTGKMRDRQALYEVKTKAVGFILSGLRRDLGIAPATDIRFA